MQAARIFLGGGRQHLRVVLQYIYEMVMLPLVWEARRRYIEFWLKVMRMNDKRMITVFSLKIRYQL